MEEFAQVSARLRFGGVGPEGKRDTPAQNRGSALEQQIGKQRLKAGLLKARQRLLGDGDAEAAQ